MGREVVGAIQDHRPAERLELVWTGGDPESKTATDSRYTPGLTYIVIWALVGRGRRRDRAIGAAPRYPAPIGARGTRVVHVE